MATLVVIAEGDLGERIAHVGEEQAAFDPENRRVLRVHARSEAAAVMLDAHDQPVVFLDEHYATSAPWIEDAFVRAARDQF